MRRALKRVPAPGGGRARHQYKVFPAPSRGWIQNENLAQTQAGGASVFENWFPTTTGARVRGGTRQYQKISTGKVLSLFKYKSGSSEKLFASDLNNIFDITTVTDVETIPSADVMGQTAGYYSAQQFGTAGGEFLVCVNGADVMWQYDGTKWYPVNTGAINALNYDGGTVAFARGETVTGAGGASATIIAINGDATSGTLYIGPVTSGPFIDDEVLTGSVAGAAVANGAESSFSTVTITNVNTDTLSQAWSFANRLFFVEESTMLAWYLPVDSVGGAANSFSLAGVFKKGGSLLFGATWSLDAGDGLDDKCVFVSTEGEVAVYEGSDPSSASTWSKVGVYQIGKPLGINATMQAGGDLLIATDFGLVPLSQAINQDAASLSRTGASRQIFPKWTDEVSNRGSIPWEILKWTDKSMLIVSLPRDTNALDAECLVANLETGAWGHWTNLDTRCLGEYNGRGFFGSNDGYVREFEIGGSDDGVPYVCTYVDQFDHLNSPAVHKVAKQCRATFKAAGPFNYKLSASSDYNVRLPAAPNSSADYIASEWDVGLWDEAIWDGAELFSVVSRWSSVGRAGYAIAPQIQITLGVTPTPKIELVSYDLTYTTGGVVV